MARPADNAALKRFQTRIRDIENEVVPKKAAIVAYGDKGTGKTTAIQALAQKLKGDGRILRLDSSDGWVSLENIPVLKSDTDNVEYATLEDLGTAADALFQRKKGFEDYTVVVLDEVSTWYLDALHAYVREQMNIPDDKPLPPFGWDYYGPVQAALLEVLKKFQRTPGLHVLMVAHEQERANKGEKEAKRMVPSMGTKLAEGIGQFSHVVARFEGRFVRGDYEREVQSWPSRAVDAKSRIKDLKSKMPAATWVKTVAAWVESSAPPLSAEEIEAIEAETIDDGETVDEEDFEVPDGD